MLNTITLIISIILNILFMISSIVFTNDIENKDNEISRLADKIASNDLIIKKLEKELKKKEKKNAKND